MKSKTTLNLGLLIQVDLMKSANLNNMNKKFNDNDNK